MDTLGIINGIIDEGSFYLTSELSLAELIILARHPSTVLSRICCQQYLWH